MNIQRWGKFGLLATVISLMFVSCDNAIYDYEGDCTVPEPPVAEPTNYQVKFKYDMNMEYADAFPKAVSSVKLFAFDQSGTLVAMQDETNLAELGKLDEFGNPGYFMPLVVKPGTYDLLAWCGLGGQESFELLGNPVIGTTKKEEIQTKMKRAEAVVNKDLNSLFHGLTTSVTLPDQSGTYTNIVPLTKNTNNIRIVLQHLAYEDVDPDMFEFTITDNNGWMAFDNSIVEDETLTYKPWRVDAGKAGIDAEGTTEVGVALAEFTVGRLMADHRPILTVTNKETGEKVLSIPIIDYALLVKGEYGKSMSDQEYLDRQDEYSMTFFLDENERWVNATVIINSWRIVINNSVIE